MPNGATTTGLGENLMAWVMFWNWRMAMSTSSHSSSWTAISSIMMLAPTEKLGASLVMTKASKLSPAPPGFSVWVIICTMSPPSEFILEWNSMQATPSPRSTSDAPEFFFTTPFDFFATVTDHTPSGTSTARVAGAGQVEVVASAGGPGIVGVPTGLAGGEQLLDAGSNRLAFLLHALDGARNAGDVPQLERTELPVETELHGAIDFDDGVGNFADAVGGIGPQVGEDAPQEGVGFVFGGREQHGEPFVQVVDVLRHLQRGQLGLLQSTVLQRLPVERQALVALGGFLLLVEAALGLVAQPFAVEHLEEERRQLEVAALVVDVGGGVAHDVAEDVESDEIAEAEGGGLGPADGSAGEGVNFFDAEVHLLHDAHDVQHGEGADAIGDEVGRVLGVHDTLAEVQIAEVRDRVCISAGSASGVGISSSRRM